MKKIISLFQRNYDGDRLVRDEITPGAEWVVAGEGVATTKWDGTCCMVRGGKLYKRYDAKHGKKPPPGFEPAQDPDPKTGHWPGWLLVGDGPEDKWHREAWEGKTPFPHWTYELIGPKIQGNPYNLEHHELIPHGRDHLQHAPRAYGELRTYLDALRGQFKVGVEGIVWHHPDGRMVKIKRKDFGLPWPVRS